MADIKINAEGLKCPLPVLKAKKTLAKMQQGQRLTMIVTDPNAPEDIAALCQNTGDEFGAQSGTNGIVIVEIRKS